MESIKKDVYLNGSKAKGYGRELREFYLELLNGGRRAGEEIEKDYLDLLRELLLVYGTLREKSLREINDNKGMKKALEWCLAGGGIPVAG